MNKKKYILLGIAITILFRMGYAQQPFEQISIDEKVQLKQDLSEKNSEVTPFTNPVRALTVPYSTSFEETNVLTTIWKSANQDIFSGWGITGGGARTGIYFMHHASPTAAPQKDDWVFSPQFIFETGKEYIVKFWARVTNAAHTGQFEIYVALDQTVLSVFGEPFYVNNSVTGTAWVEYEAYISGLNDGVYALAFHGLSDIGNIRVGIDDFSISEYSPIDAAALRLLGGLTPMVGKQFKYSAFIKNEGAVSISGYTVKLIDESDNVLATNNAGPDLEPGETTFVELVWTPATAGDFSISAKVEMPGDGVPVNDKSPALNITVEPYGTVFTGTIGDGTAQAKLPFNTWDLHNVNQCIYYDFELIGQKGAITEIQYFNNFTSDWSDGRLFTKIWMANTTQNKLDTWLPESEFELVFDGNVSLPMGINTIPILLDSPFIYTGQNLVIMVNRPRQGGYGVWTDNFFVTNNPEIPGRTRIYSHDTNIFNFTQPGSIDLNFPNIVLKMGLDGGSVSGVVTDTEMNPVEGATVQVEGSYLKYQTGVDGTYYFDFLPTGEHNLTASKFGYFEDTKTVVVETNQNTVADFVIELITRFKVSGTVIDNEFETGVEDVQITLSGYEEHSAITDENGFYIIENVYTGYTYTVTASKDGFTTYTGEVTIEEADATHDIMLFEILYPVASVTASVVDDDAVISWNPPAKVTRALIGYNVYRLSLGQPEDEWITIATNITGTTCNDDDYGTLDSGIYCYAVKVVYSNNGQSVAKQSNPLIKDLFEVTIGNGTYLHNRLPMHIDRYTSFSQTIFYPQEIGTNGGSVFALRWQPHIMGDPDYFKAVPIQIWMGETDLIDLRSGWVTPYSLTEVFYGEIDLTQVGNEMYLLLDVPYQYNGRNLVVYTFKQFSGGGYESPNSGFYGVGSGHYAKSRSVFGSSLAPDPMDPNTLGISSFLDGFPNTRLYISDYGMGSIGGVVSDENGPVAGANVTIGAITKITNAAGEYIFQALKPGIYSITVSAHGHFTAAATNVSSIANEMTIQNISLTTLDNFTVSGRVTSYDTPQGFANVEITLTGYANYTTTTNATGNYSITGVYSGFNYTVKAKVDGYMPYTGVVTVDSDDATHNIHFDEILLPVVSVNAETVGENVNVSWIEPVPYTVFRHDSGINASQVGFTGVYPNQAIGSVHKVNALLTKMMWYFTNDNPQSSLTLYVFDLGADGKPDRNTILFSAINVPNTPLQWCEYEFPEPVLAPNGFFIALGSTNGTFLSLGIDAPNTEYPFLYQTHFYTDDYNQPYGFAPFEESGQFANLMIRAEGVSFGEVKSFGYQEKIFSDAVKYGGEILVSTQSNEQVVLIQPDAQTDVTVITQIPACKEQTRVFTGYNVYRFITGTPETGWTTLATNVQGFNYLDLSWVTLGSGHYRYAVKTVYSGDELSIPRLSNELRRFTITLGSNNSDWGTTTGGGSFAESALITINAEANTGYHFVNWTENGTVVSTNAEYEITVTENRNLIANFAINTYTVNVAANTTNGGTVGGGGTYNHGQNVTVFAIVNSGYNFINWTEDGVQVSDANPYIFAAEADRVIVGNFAINTYTITVSSNNNDWGTATGGGTFNVGTAITVEAVANSGYHFVNWTENGSIVYSLPEYSFTVSADRNLVANFAINTYTITVSSNNNGWGTATGGGTFNHGTEITVEAVANTGYYFVNWTENGIQVSIDPLYSFEVISNRNLVANFSEIAPTYYTVTVIAEGQGEVEIVGYSGISAEIAEGNSVTVKATADSEWSFEKWTDEDGVVVHSLPVYTFTVSKDIVLTAHFTEVGIRDNILSNIVLYPNPFKNEINISNPAVVKSVQITNTTGQKVKSVTFDGKSISTEDLANGVYFVVIESVEGSKAVYKMVKK